MTENRRKTIATATLLVLTAIVLWQLAVTGRNRVREFAASPKGIMGTSTKLRVVFKTQDAKLAAEALDGAEIALNRVEAVMSRRIEASELSKLNRAPAGREIELSPALMEVLRTAQKVSMQTDGAFDVTCLPVIQLWKNAARTNAMPSDEAVAASLARCGWRKLELANNAAVKQSANLHIDLGAIAKGYGIDMAVQAMQASGALGGIVDVGGDVRCFGKPSLTDNWLVNIKSPFSDKWIFASLKLKQGAVCTSGDYERFSEINTQRFSHILDLRTGKPADSVPSVTVVAPTAIIADAWATALSSLGEEGLKLIPAESDIKVMMIVGTREKHKIITSGKGFDELIVAMTPAVRPPAKKKAKPGNNAGR